MIVLDSTRSLVAKLGASPATNPTFISNAFDVRVLSNKALQNTAQATPIDDAIPSAGSLTGTTYATLVAAPASGIKRKVASAYIYNISATAQNVTLALRVTATGGSTTETDFAVFTLQVGETLAICECEISVIPTTAGPGNFIKSTALTSGTTHTTGPTTRKIKVRLQAGGGGGGGTASAGASSGAGAGGSAGGYAEKTFDVSPSTGYTYAIGAAGAAGAAGNNAGGAGGNTTFAVGATTVTANGGNGGAGSAASATVEAINAGASPPAVSTNGDVNASGAPGGASLRFSGTSAISGCGGSCLFGAGGRPVGSTTTGLNAIGFGAGGGGGSSIDGATDKAGGAGAAGIIVVEEYS